MKKAIISIVALFIVVQIFGLTNIVSNNDKIIFGNQSSFFVNDAGNIFTIYGKRVSEEQFLLYFGYSEAGLEFSETLVDTLYGYPYVKEKTMPVLIVKNNKITIYYTKSRNPSDFELWRAISEDNGQTFNCEFMENNVFLPITMNFDEDVQILSYITGKLKQITKYQYYTDYESDENGNATYFSQIHNLNGPVHSNDVISVLNNPVFHSLVTTSETFNMQNVNIQQTFLGGYLENVPQENYTLPEDFDPYDPFAPYNADIVYVNLEGDHFTSKLGHIELVGEENFPVYSWYPQNAQDVEDAIQSGYNWLDPENIIYVNQVSIYDTVWTDGPSEVLENNMTIFTDKTLWIKGQISGKQFWGSSENVYIVGDITYQNTPDGVAPDDPENINENDYFGLLSLKKIIIKYKYKDPMNGFEINSDNCDDVTLYGAYCAVQKADPSVYGEAASHYDGVFTFEYQHPHGSTPDFVSISPYTGNDTLYTYVDLHKFIFPPDYSLSSDLLPYNIHGGDPVAPYNMCGYPYEDSAYQPNSGVPPYGADYPWYNPVWPEPASSIVTERGIINLYGGIYQVRRGFIHRSGTDSYNHPDNSWQLDVQTFHYGSQHPSTGYTLNYHFDKRLGLNPFEYMPEANLNTANQQIHIKVSNDNGDTFNEVFSDEVPIPLIRKHLFKYNDGYLYVVQAYSSSIFFVTIAPTGQLIDVEGIGLGELSNSIIAKKAFLVGDKIYILASDFENDYILYHQMGNESYVLLATMPKSLLSDYNVVGDEYEFAYYFAYENQEIKVYAFTPMGQMTEYNPIPIDVQPNENSKLSTFIIDHNLYYTININNPTGETSSVYYGYDTLTPSNSQNDNITQPKIVFKSYPNPFIPFTKNGKSDFKILFTLSKKERIDISIYNLKGQLIKNICNTVLSAGKHTIVWNGTDNTDKKVKSGVYLYKVKNGDKIFIKKFMLIR